MKTLLQLTRELRDAQEDLTSDPLYGAINHEALEDQDDFEQCDCCDYYAYSEGDTPEGDL